MRYLIPLAILAAACVPSISYGQCACGGNAIAAQPAYAFGGTPIVQAVQPGLIQPQTFTQPAQAFVQPQNFVQPQQTFVQPQQAFVPQQNFVQPQQAFFPQQSFAQRGFQSTTGPRQIFGTSSRRRFRLINFNVNVGSAADFPGPQSSKYELTVPSFLILPFL